MRRHQSCNSKPVISYFDSMSCHLNSCIIAQLRNYFPTGHFLLVSSQEFEVSSINRAKIPKNKNHPTISRVIFCCWYFSSVFGRNFKFLWSHQDSLRLKISTDVSLPVQIFSVYESRLD